MAASRQGFTDIVRVLVDAGAEVNAKSNRGWTALKMAVFADHPGTARALLEVGGNPTSKDEDSETILQCALRYASRATIDLIKGWTERVV